MEGRNQNYTGRNQEAAPIKWIHYLYGDTLSPKFWGNWCPSFSSKPWTLWFAPCCMEGSQQHPLSNWSLHPTVRYTLDSETGTKMCHELHVVRGSLLMVTALRSRWVGKGSPFSSAWLVNRAANAMSSIEEMFCSNIWLLVIVDDELWYKIRLLHELLIFSTTVPTLFLVFISYGCPDLCGSLFKKLRTSWHGVHCSFLMGSARAKGSTVPQWRRVVFLARLIRSSPVALAAGHNRWRVLTVLVGPW